ncbi:MAG: chitobiase/beta-hexosaminidase C-terminal domain-containing protein, partial [Prevotella sp.]|nr:chitobiase/beta-hexosaminidase C-terminal domain-containing protein [Prevotella sp.]
MMKQIRYFFTLLLLAVASVGWADSYVKVTNTSDITDGTYLIVYETGNVAFNGALETLDAVSNTIDVTISNGVIQSTEAVDAAAFTINVKEGTLKSASGFYVGVSSYGNGLKQSENAEDFINGFAIDEAGNALITVAFDEGPMTMKYNSASNQTRFRYYKSGQKDIQLYKKGEAKPVPAISGITPFTESTTVTITPGVAGDKIYYTTDGTTPTAKSKLYASPFTLTETTTVKAVEMDSKGKLGNVVEKIFVKEEIPETPEGVVIFDATVDKSESTAAGAAEITKQGVTISITNGVLGNGTEYRVYKNQTFTVSSKTAKIQKVVMTCIGEGTSQYGPGLFSLPEGGVGTYETEGLTGTWEGDAAELSLVAKEGQVRMTKVEVYLGESSGKILATVTIGATSLNVGETTTVTTDGPALTLTTSNASVASVSGTTVKGVAAGTATITAKWSENDQYEAGEKQFTVTVTDPNAPGSENNPYTVAQALQVISALADGKTTDTEVYVKGVISEIEEVSVDHGNATYSI